MIRSPAVAGRFYSDDARELARQLKTLSGGAEPAEKVHAIGCLVPHAGYMYSGHVAGAVYRKLELPKRLILLGPRHHPQGEALAILSEGAWRTPLGEARIDSALAADLKRACPLLREDALAHRAEHALEVQLPFLQSLVGEFCFVPIALGPIRFSPLEELGRAIGQVVAAQAEEVLVVASSDMNHYESDKITRVKDRKALDKILALDPQGLYDTVRREDISMCGIGPAVSMLTAAQHLGATRGELLRYATSGEVNGELDTVVGYAGVIVH